MSASCSTAHPPALPPRPVPAESEGRLRQQHELYESVRGERNSYSRSLVEVQARGQMVLRCAALKQVRPLS